MANQPTDIPDEEGSNLVVAEAAEVLLTREEAARYLGLEVDRIKTWIGKGRLKPVIMKNQSGQSRFMLRLSDVQQLVDPRNR